MPKDGGILNIYSYAKRALDEADGDWQKAAAIFRGWLDDDPDLKAALLEQFLEKGIWLAIRHVSNSKRRWLNRGEQDQPKSDDNGTSGLEAMAATNAAKYFDYPLVGGKRLGDATIEDLEIERDMHRQFAVSNDIKAQRFDLIISAMKKKRSHREKTAEELITLDQLMKLWEQAKHE